MGGQQPGDISQVVKIWPLSLTLAALVNMLVCREVQSLYQESVAVD